MMHSLLEKIKNNKLLMRIAKIVSLILAFIYCLSFFVAINAWIALWTILSIDRLPLINGTVSLAQKIQEQAWWIWMWVSMGVLSIILVFRGGGLLWKMCTLNIHKRLQQVLYTSQQVLITVMCVLAFATAVFSLILWNHSLVFFGVGMPLVGIWLLCILSFTDNFTKLHILNTIKDRFFPWAFYSPFLGAMVTLWVGMATFLAGIFGAFEDANFWGGTSLRALRDSEFSHLVILGLVFTVMDSVAWVVLSWRVYHFWRRLLRTRPGCDTMGT